MPTIKVILRNGEETLVEATTGFSLMEAIRDAGIDELQALCGGCCSCATCHVHIAEDQVGWLPLSSDEDDLLEGAEDRNEFSRLSCQVPVTDDMDGMTVMIGAE